MSKIVVISDIHGNLSPLLKVLEKIEEEKPDKLFVLGDLALCGANINETVDKIREISSIYDTSIIKGNTDRMIVDGNLETGEFIPHHPIMRNTVEFAKNVISDENFEFLKNLPEKVSVEVDGIKMLLVHGSPRQIDENIMPARSIEEIKPMLDGVEESVILCGHTHLPCGYQIDEKTVINDGSVGRPFTEDSKACYVVIQTDTHTKSFAVEHKFVKFDAEALSKELVALDFEGANIIADMSLKSTGKFPVV